MTRRSAALFITSPDTDAGKTFVTAALARRFAAEGLTVGVYKPVASGCRREGDRLVADDAVVIWEAAGRPGTLDEVCPQRFEAPLAPPRAADAEGRSVDASLLRTGFEVWQSRSDVVLVEGAGGLMSPLSTDDFNADLAADLALPVLVVAPNRLGTIGLTLMTLITASTFGDGLDVEGIMLSDTDGRTDDPSRATNAADLSQLAAPPVLASLAHGETTLPSTKRLDRWIARWVEKSRKARGSSG